MRWMFFGGVLILGACAEDGIRFGELVLDTGLSTDTAAPSSNGTTCDRIAMDGTCSEYVGSDWTLNDISAECNATLTSGSCPSTDALGTCRIDPAGGLTVDRTFYLGPYLGTADADLLENNCVLNGGLWSAP